MNYSGLTHIFFIILILSSMLMVLTTTVSSQQFSTTTLYLQSTLTQPTIYSSDSYYNTTSTTSLTMTTAVTPERQPGCYRALVYFNSDWGPTQITYSANREVTIYILNAQRFAQGVAMNSFPTPNSYCDQNILIHFEEIAPGTTISSQQYPVSGTLTEYFGRGTALILITAPLLDVKPVVTLTLNPVVITSTITGTVQVPVASLVTMTLTVASASTLQVSPISDQMSAYIAILAVLVIALFATLHMKSKKKKAKPVRVKERNKSKTESQPVPTTEGQGVTEKADKQFCISCGKRLPTGSKFCNKCGTEQP